ncbi:hypothetical protein E4U42_007170 [Claviceps africana]|uniref:protein-ribulosamine 3-kinase n=1 Tax=Claviceps africana TaxID=83212 RepID=A0A8K0J231_9HYPO|nr:hypothetical protein E4U42_007170 [Claviceps africana]
MPRSVDVAILRALHLQDQDATMSSHGHSGFASTFRLTAMKDGQTMQYFVKTGSGKGAERMFIGEHASLNAIHDIVPQLCPRSHAQGSLSTQPNTYFLVTDFLRLDPPSPAEAKGPSGASLAAKLAKLHTTPAPIPEGHSTPMFGFPVPTCCGETAQDNTWKASWADFYAENRLGGILETCVRRQGPDAELRNTVRLVADRVVPRLIGEATVKSITPVVVHGDLWSGNHAVGQMAGRGGWEDVVFDPSAVYAHSEYELGIMNMFGGFGAAFWDEYDALVPKTEPRGEWEDRLLLYELYHHLNHFAMFGGGYRAGAMSIMKRLMAKYGQLD